MTSTRAAPLAMAAAVTVAALASVVAGALSNDQLPVFNESAGWEYMMEDMMWPGPERGCAAAEGAGGTELRLQCSLPAARVSLTTDRAASYLTLKCEPNGDRVGRVTCEELRQNAGEALWNHTGEALAQHAGSSRVLRSLSVVGCELKESLQCVLALVEATDVTTVVLQGVPMPLQAYHMQGLKNLTHLRILDIGENVTRLPYGALTVLPSLRRLDVHGGSLQLQAGGAGWRPLQQLQMLELAEGGVRSLPALAFLGLSQLRNLSLWANKIETLDESAFEGLSQLECLSLNRNKLQALPPQVLRPTPRLRLLHLYGNRIPALPQLGHLQNLEEIWLNNGNESSLLLHNDTFAELSALRKLKLESCGVTATPSQLLHGCRALTELSLRGNWLVELPPELFVEQSSLRVLDLGRNRLRTVPRTLLVNVKALEDLNLSSNYIELLPNGIFLSLAAIKRLDLSRNRLTELHSQVFEGLSNIQELALSYNNLTMAVDADVEGRVLSPLAELKSLRRITLAHNDVRRFMDDWRDLHHLEALDLSYNVIVELSDVDLQLLSEAVVDVRHNQISHVQQLPSAMLEAGEGMLSRARFLLDDNPFHCDCRMYDFLVALRRSKAAKQFDVGRAECTAPLVLASVLLTDVSPDALICTLPAPDCPANCTCALRPASDILELDCEYVPRAVPNPFEYGAKAVRLRLHSPLTDVAMLPAAVRVVDLSGLNLDFPPAASTRIFNLTVDLSNNSLTSAPLALLEANCKVLLAGNPLACDCEHQESVMGLRRHWARVGDGDVLRCVDGQSVKGKDVAALCAGRDALALGLGSGVAIALVVLIIFRYRTEIRLILGRFKLFDFLLPKKDLRMLEKKYDAFVSFSHHDDVYVRDVLVPALEGGRRPLRLCLHYRDWEVGDLIPEQIDRSVRESWRTIVVLSEDFIRSMWGRHEFRVAHGKERVIVLVIGDALRAMEDDEELRAYKKTHTCIMASHPLVWDRIRDAVYRSKCAVPVASEPVGGVVHGAGDKYTKVAGGLDVQLCNGQLVNEVVTPNKPKKFPTSFHNLAYINSSYLSPKIDDSESKPGAVIDIWCRSDSKDQNQNCLRLPK